MSDAGQVPAKEEVMVLIPEDQDRIAAEQDQFPRSLMNHPDQTEGEVMKNFIPELETLPKCCQENGVVNYWSREFFFGRLRKVYCYCTECGSGFLIHVWTPKEKV